MFNQDFCDLLAAFNDAGVRYLIVGGYAFGHHAKPRTTKDIDIWVEPAKENAAKVCEALGQFGAPRTHFSRADFEVPGSILQVGVEPNRIDILTDVGGVSFAEAWEERVPALFGEIPTQYIGMRHLIESKRAAGRKQDLADLAILEKLAQVPSKSIRKRRM